MFCVKFKNLLQKLLNDLIFLLSLRYIKITLILKGAKEKKIDKQTFFKKQLKLQNKFSPKKNFFCQKKEDEQKEKKKEKREKQRLSETDEKQVTKGLLKNGQKTIQ